MEPVAFNIRFSSYFKFGKPPFLQLLSIPRPQLRDINDINLWFSHLGEKSQKKKHIPNSSHPTHPPSSPPSCQRLYLLRLHWLDLWSFRSTSPVGFFIETPPVSAVKGGKAGISQSHTTTSLPQMKAMEKPCIFLRVSPKKVTKEFSRLWSQLVKLPLNC